jgi:hypothetical protein
MHNKAAATSATVDRPEAFEWTLPTLIPML